MNKKILLLGLVLILLSSFVSANNVPTAGYEWYDDFDDQSITDYTVSTGSFSFDTTTFPGETVLKTTTAGPNILPITIGTLSFTDNIAVAYRQYQPADSGYIYSFLATTDYTTANTIRYITYWAEDKVDIKVKTLAGSETAMTISGATWYDVCTNIAVNDLELYIDDVLKVSSTSTTGAMNTYTAASLRVDNSGAFLDDFRIWEGTCDNEPTPSTQAKQIEVHAENEYTSSAITNFNVSFTNVTDTYNQITTNGSVFFDFNEKVLYDVVVQAEDYFNYSLSSYNLTTNFNASMHQTEINFTFYNPETSTFITNMTLIDLNNSVNVSTTNGTIYLRPSAENISFRFYDGNLYADNFTSILFTGLEKSSIVINHNTPLSYVYFKDVLSQPIYNASIEIKYPDFTTITRTTDIEGKINFSSVKAGTQYFGTYSITFESLEGYVSPATTNFTLDASTIPLNETVIILEPGININVYDRETRQLLTGIESQLVIIGLLNQTTTTGQFVISNLSIVADTYSVQVLSNGYFTEQQQFEFTTQENVTIDFYLLNLTGSNTGTHFVSALNEFYITEPETKVNLLEYDLGTKTYISVSECYTNTNGECQFAVELNIKRYIITGVKTIDGAVFSDQTSPFGTFIQVDEDVTNLFLKLFEAYTTTISTQLSLDIDDNLNMIKQGDTNTTSINVSFSTEDDSVTTVCVDYYSIDGLDTTLVNQDCATTGIGIIQSSYLLSNRSLDYNVKIYQVSGNSGILFYNKYISSTDSFESRLDEDELLSPFILVPYILLLVAAMYSRKLYIFFIGAPIVSWYFVLKFPTIMLTTVAALITVLCIFMALWARKKSDPQ